VDRSYQFKNAIDGVFGCNLSGHHTPKGFEIDQFKEAFNRYLVDLSATPHFCRVLVASLLRDFLVALKPARNRRKKSPRNHPATANQLQNKGLPFPVRGL